MEVLGSAEKIAFGAVQGSRGVLRSALLMTDEEYYIRCCSAQFSEEKPRPAEAPEFAVPSVTPSLRVREKRRVKGSFIRCL